MVWSMGHGFNYGVIGKDFDTLQNPLPAFRATLNKPWFYDANQAHCALWKEVAALV